MYNVNPRTLLLAAAVSLLGFAFAEGNSNGYDPSGDVTVTVDNPVTNKLAETLGVDKVGDAAFEAQEDVHKAVEGTTGKSISHSYIKVCLGKSCLPVDPFRFSR